MDFFSSLEAAFSAYMVAPLSAVIFFDVMFWDPDVSMPLAVVWLIVGALYFTARFQFINFRAFTHAIDCVRGRYTAPDAEGEISHFQALSAALSATVGLGNIAGVAVAVGIGGPGHLCSPVRTSKARTSPRGCSFTGGLSGIEDPTTTTSPMTRGAPVQ